LLAEKRVAAEPATKQELDDLRSIVTRSVADAETPGLSDDGRFSMAYNAGRTLALMVVRAEGYRPKSAGGGHFNTFMAFEAADPGAFQQLAAYLDACRQKRNDLSYDVANVAATTETDELIRRTKQFQQDAEAWITARHPTLA